MRVIPSEMDFHAPNAILHLFWLAPVLLGAIWAAARTRRTMVARFLSGDALGPALSASVSVGRRRLRHALFLAGAALLLTALARPYWGTRLVRRPAASRDLLVLLDTSRSMLARDVAPTRLDFAKLLVRRLAERTPGSRLGLVAFAGHAFLECPLTQDHAGFLLFLDNADTDSIPVGGTNIEAALDEALDAFKAAEGGHRAVILVTDGDQLDGDFTKPLDQFREQGIPLLVVGLGDPRFGTYIQLEGNQFVKDGDGKPVKTRLNQEGLQQLAEATGGLYLHATVAQDGLDHLVQRVEALVPESQEGNTVARPIERYQGPLLLALLCFALRLTVGERRRLAAAALALALAPASAQDDPWDEGVGLTPAATAPADRQIPRHQGSAPGTAASPPDATTSTPVRPSLGESRHHFARQAIADYTERLETADNDHQRALLHYNIGVNHQRLGDDEQAETAYLDALRHADTLPRLKAAALQNLGTLKHRPAAEALARDPDEALAAITEAQNYYREAMRADPEASEAARNQEIALLDKRLFEELKRLQEMLKQQQQEAREKAEQAHQQQQQANQASSEPDQQQQQEQSADSAKQARDAARKVAETARRKGLDQAAEQYRNAAETLDQAIEQQQQAIDSSRPEAERRQAAEQAEALLDRARRQLGSKPEQQPPQPPPQQSDNGNQPPEAADGDRQQADPDQPSPKPDPPEPAENNQRQPGDPQTPPPESLNVDKQEALRILRDMAREEGDLKQQLKQIQRQKLRYRDVERNW